jgi:hypothetical protein
MAFLGLASCSSKDKTDEAAALDRSQYEIMLRTLDVKSNGTLTADRCIDINISIVRKGTQSILPSPEDLTGTLALATPAGAFYSDRECGATGNSFAIRKDTNGTNAGLKIPAGIYSLSATITGYSLQKALDIKVE